MNRDMTPTAAKEQGAAKNTKTTFKARLASIFGRKKERDVTVSRLTSSTRALIANLMAMR